MGSQNRQETRTSWELVGTVGGGEMECCGRKQPRPLCPALSQGAGHPLQSPEASQPWWVGNLESLKSGPMTSSPWGRPRSPESSPREHCLHWARSHVLGAQLLKRKRSCEEERAQAAGLGQGCAVSTRISTQTRMAAAPPLHTCAPFLQGRHVPVSCWNCGPAQLGGVGA